MAAFQLLHERCQHHQRFLQIPVPPSTVNFTWLPEPSLHPLCPLKLGTSVPWYFWDLSLHTNDRILEAENSTGAAPFLSSSLQRVSPASSPELDPRVSTCDNQRTPDPGVPLYILHPESRGIKGWYQFAPTSSPQQLQAHVAFYIHISLHSRALLSSISHQHASTLDIPEGLLKMTDAATLPYFQIFW